MRIPAGGPATLVLCQSPHIEMRLILGFSTAATSQSRWRREKSGVARYRNLYALEQLENFRKVRERERAWADVLQNRRRKAEDGMRKGIGWDVEDIRLRDL